MRNEWFEGYILHVKDFSETSLIAEVFSKELGKVSLIAKGAKKPKSKFFGALQTSNKVRVCLSGRSDLKTLIEVELIASLGSAVLAGSAYSYLYINELIANIIPKDAHAEDIYRAYDKLMRESQETKLDEYSLRAFEMELLELLGYGIHFAPDIVATNKQSYHYQFERGFVIIDDNEGFSYDEMVALEEGKLHLVSKAKLKELTKEAISHCIEGKEIHSRRIFKKLNS